MTTILSANKFIRYMLIITLALGLLIFSFLLLLFFVSSGKPKSFLDNNANIIKNSISEKLFLEINGFRQGMFIKGESLDNPILLYLHGGMPDYFLTEKYPTRLEKIFTVVWWEQRGCGISSSSELRNNSTSIDQIVDDAITLTNSLLKRFKKDKIYLMGHSGGTFIGVYTIDKAPELYHAYIGVAQMSNQQKSEKIAYEYMINKYKELGNKKMAESLEGLSFEQSSNLPYEYLKIRDKAMHELGIGTMKTIKNLVTDLFIPSLMFSEYTIFEKINLWYYKSKSGISQNWDIMSKTDLAENKKSFKIPVYFFHGIDDYTCSYYLAKEYYKQIIAPLKGFYTFQNSAHSPLFEEPVKMIKILTNDIINSRNELSDQTD